MGKKRKVVEVLPEAGPLYEKVSYLDGRVGALTEKVSHLDCLVANLSTRMNEADRKSQAQADIIGADNSRLAPLTATVGEMGKLLNAVQVRVAELEAKLMARVGSALTDASNRAEGLIGATDTRWKERAHGLQCELANLGTRLSALERKHEVAMGAPASKIDQPLMTARERIELALVEMGKGRLDAARDQLVMAKDHLRALKDHL